MGFFEALITTLSFGQLLVLFLILLSSIGLLLFFSVRALLKKDYTVTLDGQGKKIKVSKKDSLNIMLLFESLKIKDDIHRVSDVAHKTVKKKIKELLPKAQDLQLHMFKELLCIGCDFENDIDEHRVLLDNRDFLYYSLLLEKAYSTVFTLIMGAIEENGLNSKENIHSYVSQKADSLFLQSKHVIDSLYMGIMEVDKRAHDEALMKLKPKLIDIYSGMFQYAITVSKKEYSKREELKGTLYEKIKSIEGMSHYQLENLFTEIDSNSFLGVD